MDHGRYWCQGTVRIKAHGYWRSAAGPKGIFGYYPHLTDDVDGQRLPAYPDTQLHNILRAAAVWAGHLDGSGNPQRKTLHRAIFGNLRTNQGTVDDFTRTRAGDTPWGPSSRKLRVTDLTLDKDSQKRWEPSRFVVKPRIAVDDETGCVTDGMLAFQELAFLDGLSLEARVFLGPFQTAQELSAAQALLTEAGELFFGVGSQRSRGQGQGEVSLEWQTVEQIKAPSQLSPVGASCQLRLCAHTNLRLRLVESGGGQAIATAAGIGAGTLKATLAKLHHEFFGTWPSPVEMGTITTTGLYPVAGQDLATPSPVTPPKADDQDAGKKKNKPLGNFAFVQAPNKDNACRVVRVTPHSRMRNRMGGDFVTEDDGLFIQEHLPAGTTLAGLLNFCQAQPCHATFQARCVWLLSQPWLEMGGGLFAGQIAPVSKPNAVDAFPMRLVTDHLPWLLEDLTAYGKQWSGAAFRVGVRRSYHVILKRPRRSQLVIMPGSVVPPTMSEGAAAVPWPGADQDRRPTWRTIELEAPAPPEMVVRKQKHLDEVKNWDLTISDSQIGFLRELLHPGLSQEYVTKLLNERIRKFEGTASGEGRSQEETKLLEICRMLRDIITPKQGKASDFSGQVQRMRESIQYFMEERAVSLHEKREKRKAR